MYINPEYVKYAGVFVGSAAIGFGVGYKVMERRAFKVFDQAAEKEIEDTITFFEMRIDTLEKELKSYKEPVTFEDLTVESRGESVLLGNAKTAHTQYNKMSKATPEDVKKAIETLNSAKEPVFEHSPDSDEAKDDVVLSNVFKDHINTEQDEDVDLDVENRDPTIPYVITEDEFGENKYNHDQTSFTYYEGDDIVTDQRDQVVPEVDETVGEDNLTKFGLGNRNPNMVYIRNERLGLDFEINRIEGSYSEISQGFIRHSQDRHHGDRRFRGDDE